MKNESVVLRKVGLNEYRKTNIFYSSTKLENFENNSKSYKYFWITEAVEGRKSYSFWCLHKVVT